LLEKALKLELLIVSSLARLHAHASRSGSILIKKGLSDLLNFLQDEV
jgi:hypothetical protein